MLTPEQVARTYDRIGRWQDTQRFYEDRALKALLEHAALGRAHSVLELGCGTGRNARRLLQGVLPADCRYLGIDLSTTMVRLSRAAVAPWADRAEVIRGDATTFSATERYDRVVSLFVVDLLSHEAIASLLDHAARTLAPGGRLCIAALAEGERGIPRAISSLWKRVHALSPALLGGCRPLAIAERLDPSVWRVLHLERLCAYGLCSDVLVAETTRGA